MGTITECSIIGGSIEVPRTPFQTIVQIMEKHPAALRDAR
jgi:hypothetical protein